MEFLIPEMINDPKSLDRIFAEMHEAYQKEMVPMTNEQTRYSIGVMMGNEEQTEGAYEDFQKQSWEFGGFFKRCEIFPIKYEKKLQIWLALMTFEYGIGAMILVAYYTQWAISKLKEKGYAQIGDEITLNFVTEFIFPMGVFRKKTIHTFWDKQKVKSIPDNLIDYPSAGMSFMPIERTEPINKTDMVW